MTERSLRFLDPEEARIVIHVAKNESVRLELASFASFHDLRIEADVEEGGNLVAAYCDFSIGSGLFSFSGRLLGPNSSIEWHLASLTKGNDKRTYETAVSHESIQTSAIVSNYGIARDGSRLSFKGASTIPAGAKKTSTRQVAKIIVFDPDADGEASPALVINDNDVEASHAASVGRLSSEHLFYLESRGIALEEAKRLIALGYLKPIASFFGDEAMKARIEGYVERGI